MSDVLLDCIVNEIEELKGNPYALDRAKPSHLKYTSENGEMDEKTLVVGIVPVGGVFASFWLTRVNSASTAGTEASTLVHVSISSSVRSEGRDAGVTFLNPRNGSASYHI